MRRLTTAQLYNRRHHATHKLYCGLDKAGKTQSVLAYTKAEAKAELRKGGFVAVKIVQT